MSNCLTAVSSRYNLIQAKAGIPSLSRHDSQPLSPSPSFDPGVWRLREEPPISSTLSENTPKKTVDISCYMCTTYSPSRKLPLGDDKASCLNPPSPQSSLRPTHPGSLCPVRFRLSLSRSPPFSVATALKISCGHKERRLVWQEYLGLKNEKYSNCLQIFLSFLLL